MTDKEVYLAGFEAGATEIVKETAKMLGALVTPWNQDDRNRATMAYIEWLSTAEDRQVQSDE